jgi:hypothetical protein
VPPIELIVGRQRPRRRNARNVSYALADSNDSTRLPDERLPSASADDDVAAKADARRGEEMHDLVQVADLDLKPVPTTRFRESSIGHRLACPAATARGVQQQSQITMGQHGEPGAGTHRHREPE